MAVASGSTSLHPKFAYVRFLEDNVKTTVLVADIKRFQPKDLDDFNSDRAYLVKWSDKIGQDDTDDGEGEFYKAQILKLAATKAQLNELLAASRVRYPKVLDTSVEETTDDDGNEDDSEIESEVASLVKEKKAQKKLVNNATSKNLKAILENKMKEKKGGPLFTKQSSQKSKRPFSEIEEVEELQTKVGHLRKELRSSQDEAERLRKKLGETRAELLQYKELNKRIQDTLLTKLKSSGTQQMKGKRPPPSPCAQVKVHSLRTEPEQHSEDSTGKTLDKKDGKIHIGGDVWMDSNRWSAICNEPKHSMFVKNMMLAIWGTSTLKGKSLEGKTCPRFKGDRAAKPPLTPTKVSVMKERFMDRLKKHHPETEKQQEEFSKFNKYVCQKLQDNSRGAVKSEKDQTQ